MELVLIVAMAENQVIGKDGQIPWRIKEDMQHFKDLTIGSPCIMGSKTYESIPPRFRPLPERENVVLTRDQNYSSAGIVVVHSFDEALAHCRNQREAFICGGSKVYEIALPYADRLEITHVDGDVVGDTFFPEIDWTQWFETEREIREGYSFATYQRK